MLRRATNFFCTGALLGLAVCGAAHLAQSIFAFSDLRALFAGLLIVLACSFLLALVTD